MLGRSLMGQYIFSVDLGKVQINSTYLCWFCREEVETMSYLKIGTLKNGTSRWALCYGKSMPSYLHYGCNKIQQGCYAPLVQRRGAQTIECKGILPCPNQIKSNYEQHHRERAPLFKTHVPDYCLAKSSSVMYRIYSIRGSIVFVVVYCSNFGSSAGIPSALGNFIAYDLIITVCLESLFYFESFYCVWIWRWPFVEVFSAVFVFFFCVWHFYFFKLHVSYTYFFGSQYFNSTMFTGYLFLLLCSTGNISLLYHGLSKLNRISYCMNWFLDLVFCNVIITATKSGLSLAVIDDFQIPVKIALAVHGVFNKLT